MKELIKPKKFQARTLATIAQADTIINEYQAAGFNLTLRQLYYQFVARDLIENSDREYNKLGRTISDARLAGLVDWDAIEDRVRNLKTLPTWETGADLLTSAVNQFKTNKWLDQDYYVEVWIEKDALIGVIEPVCQELEVPYFASRGYNSQSEMWRAGKRFKAALNRAQYPLIIYLGDHDPSGLDMSRDITDRMTEFTGRIAHIERIALNMDQVDQYKPPPNPTKQKDTRSNDYIKRFGGSSWELDALDPRVIGDLVHGTILKYRDEDKWQDSLDRQQGIFSQLRDVTANFRSQGI